MVPRPSSETASCQRDTACQPTTFLKSHRAAIRYARCPLLVKSIPFTLTARRILALQHHPQPTLPRFEIRCPSRPACGLSKSPTWLSETLALAKMDPSSYAPSPGLPGEKKNVPRLTTLTAKRQEMLG
ncbi:hypothetical protein EMPG_14630 [Blastomyces silverae]|uniref:Uncharacterized protein n=1 Tax=Blastomyces silverae TaxID=2060906 RepID=A0A0H1BEQ1_9EURO|nr:hypothetical protein EMPG_14630 [Blastomyces silverae]